MRTIPLIATAAVAALAARQVRDRAPFARMLGSSIARPDAAGWVTDFLNATHHQRPGQVRDPSDLRLALTILTTYWDRHDHRRLRGSDALAFHRAFGRLRLTATEGAPRGQLDRPSLLTGAERLLGDWFTDAYDDPARRGWGIAFPTTGERDAYDPTIRLRAARLGPLTPPVLPPSEQVWHTYAPVPVHSAEGVVALLTRPEVWPDFATQIGRFTPLRPGGLAGPDLRDRDHDPVHPPLPRVHPRLRDHHPPGDRRGPRRPCVCGSTSSTRRWSASGATSRRSSPTAPRRSSGSTSRPITATSWAPRATGSSSTSTTGANGCGPRGPGTTMPFPLDQAYRRVGRESQAHFWGEGDVSTSMLHQIAAQSAGAA